MDLTEFLYFAKKRFALFPGVKAPISAPAFANHYAQRQRQRSTLRASLDAVIGTAFQAWIPLRAKAVERKFKLGDAWRRNAIDIARRRFVDPNDIALFRIERADQLDGYIRRFEDAAFNKIINPAGWKPDCELMNKTRFYKRCAKNGLPHPDVAANLESGVAELVAPLTGPMIAKPSRGEGGRGVFAFDHGLPLDRASAAALVARNPDMAKGAWVVQRRLVPDPAIADIALNALPTVRMTTILNEGGVPELVNAVIRLASREDVVVDNMKAGGILSSVDLKTGTLGIGCKGYGGGDHEVHPVTGAPITGRVLPHWTAAEALVVDAHARGFGEYALIGWDVALTPEGPVLVEGNAKPGVLMPQRSGRRGLANQRYGELLAWHLARVTA